MRIFPLVWSVTLLLILLNSQEMNAQDQKLQFEHLTIEQGLSQNDVHHIIQDQKGYLWFATTDGLNKYDGYNFVTYKFDPHDSTSLAQNTVIELWEDKEGNIWVGLVGEGIGKFDPQTEKFTRYPPNTEHPTGLRDGIVSAFNEDIEGNIWVGTARIGELRKFSKETGQFFPENYTPLKSNNYYINELYKDREGNFWMGTSNGLYQLILPTNKTDVNPKVKFTHYQQDPDNSSTLRNNEVNVIYEDRAGILWVGTDEGLRIFNKKTEKFSHYLHDAKNSSSFADNILRSKNFHALSGKAINRNAIVEDLQGNLWIGTTNGLYQINKERIQCTAYFHDQGNPGSIGSNDIESLLVDNSGILWIGSIGGGISKLDPNKRPFALFHHDPHNFKSLSNNTVMAICEDKSGTVWIGTEGGGLNRYDKRTGKFTHYRHEPGNSNSLSNDAVSAILEDSKGNLWIGCDDGVLNKLDRNTEVFEHYTGTTNKFKDVDDEYIFTIYEDRQAMLWLGTTNGIKRLNPETGTVTHYLRDPNNQEGISDYWAYAICEDNSGNLWVGTYANALNKFDRKTGKFIHYKHDKNDPSSISSHTIRSIYKDSKGNLWFGTLGGGLCLLDQKKGTFKAFMEKDGLANNTVYSILEDNQGNLWLGTNKGLSRFSPTTQTFTNYDASDGLQSNQFASGYLNTGAAFKGKDGTLYFGGIGGLNIFDPQHLESNSLIPPIVITQFKLFDKLMPGKNEWGEIHLNYNENYFSFEFAALNYTNSQKNQYAYQLTGVDKDWVYSGTRRFASYTNLDPGEYIFKVKGSNNDGVWNKQGASMRIIILPPWWQTWWAYSLYALAFVGGVWGFIAYRSRSLRRENKLLEEKVEERTAEVMAQKEEIASQRDNLEHTLNELQSTQAQLIQKEKMASLGELTAGIAHEIQNPLNFVNNFAEVSEELVEELKQEIKADHKDDALAITDDLSQNLEKIHHHGRRADSIVKSMLQHSRASSGEKQATDINALADEYLRLSYHGLRAKDKDFNAKLITDFDDTIGKVEAVPQELGRVLLNLYNNAFYATEQKQKISQNGYLPQVKVSTRKLADKIEISVRDNGTGMPEAVKQKVFQPFFTTKPAGEGTGLGLSLSYDIITKGYGGEMKVESKEGEYAEFVIQLPNISR